MAKISMKEKLKDILFLHLVFSKMSATKTQNGAKVIILELAEPIPFIRGSQSIDIGNDQIVQINATDVKELRVFEDDMDDGFQWDDEVGLGYYDGEELAYDVSKRQEVWLRKTSFAVSGRGFRGNAARQKFSAIYGATAPVTGEKSPAGNTIVAE